MRLLDLFCCAGGAGMGYSRAGFDVVGVDIAPQPRYPFEFIQAEAIEYVKAHGHEYDAIHASPPCQASSALTKGTNRGRIYEDLIPQTRAALGASGRPYVIENVQGSDLRRDATLCGEMFGLAVIRHRYFEVSGFALTPPYTYRTVAVSRDGDTASTTTAPISQCTAREEERARSNNGNRPWEFIGQTSGKSWPKLFRRPTRNSLESS